MSPVNDPFARLVEGDSVVATAPEPQPTEAMPNDPFALLGQEAPAQPPPEPVAGRRDVPQLRATPQTVGDVLGEMAGDIMEGATAPFTGSWNAALGLLSDPMFRVLPVEGRDKYLEEAERLGWKGAAFWGSMAVGGPLAKLPVAMAWRLGAAGAASGTVFAGIEGVPDLLHQGKDPKQYLNDVVTMGVFGGLTGGALAAVPGAARLAGKAAVIPVKGMNLAIDLIPGGKQVRAKTGMFVKEAFGSLWRPEVFTSGDSALRGMGLMGLADQLVAARKVATLKAAELVAGMERNLLGLTDDQAKRVTFFIENFDFTDPLAWDTARAYTLDKGDERLFAIAEREARRMIGLGEMMRKTGMQLYDPESGTFNLFALRKNYIPHKFVNPEAFREGGEARDKALQILMKKTGRDKPQAEEWLDNFADRIESSNNGTFEGKFPAGTSGHYLIGRRMGLPGYETDIRKILPQYYEHVGRRLTNHIFFGDDALSEAVRAAAGPPKMLVGGKLTPEEALVSPGPVEYTPPGKPGTSMWQIIYRRKQEAERLARQKQAIEFKYPKAFSQLEAVPEGEGRRLATTLLNRQMGMLDEPQFGKGFLNEAAKLEVITKLALGAIAQPSQMMSAVVRTGWRGSFKSLMAVVGRDPEIFDIAMRSGATLRSVVREAQMSLTGQETAFLDKVLFTQFDVTSRVYGAVQGALHADFVAKDLVRATRQLERVKAARGIVGQASYLFGVEKALMNRIAKMEVKFKGLGINPVEVVESGGTLTNEQLLSAAQKVSFDVNFWGDQLSLPAFYRSAYGKYITQFKSFGFQQTKLVKDQMVKPFMRWVRGEKGGDPGPLTRFALLMPAGGEAISNLKAIARARDRSEDVIERMAENIANAAGFGLVADAVRATDFGVSGTLGLMVGPIGGDVGKVGAAFGELKKGRPQKAGRFAIEYVIPAAVSRVVPGAAPLTSALAPAASNLLFPKKGEPK